MACSKGVQQYMPALLESAPARKSAAAEVTSPARAAHVRADVAYLSHELARAPAASNRNTTALWRLPAAHTSELEEADNTDNCIMLRNMQSAGYCRICS